MGRGDGGRECRYLELPFPYYCRSLFLRSFSWLDSVIHSRGPWFFRSFSLGLGPPRSEVLYGVSTTSALSGFLRRPRFGLSVLRCSDSVLLAEVRGLSGLSSLGLSRSEVL